MTAAQSHPFGPHSLTATPCRLNWIGLKYTLYSYYRVKRLLPNIMTIQIGELAKRTACPVQTIRYYEREGLLPPPERSSGNFRLYGERHIERLQFILHCRSLDMPLSDVRALLRYREQPREDCGAVNTLLDKHIHEVERRIEALAALKRHLYALRESCSDGRAAEACGILQGLSDASYGCDADVTRQG